MVRDTASADLSVELGAVDALAGACAVLATIDKDGGWDQQAEQLECVAKCLPVFFDARTCQQNLNAFKGDETAQKLATWLTSFADFNRQAAKVKADENGAHGMSEKFNRFSQFMLALATTKMEAVMNHVWAVAEKVEKNTPDLKDVLANVDEKLSTLTNWDGRKELVDDIKGLNANDASLLGLQSYDALSSCLQGLGVERVEPMPADGFGDFTKVRTKVMSSRHQGRLALVCRGAALAVQDQAPGMVDRLMSDAKTLRVSIPKQIVKKLEALKPA